MITTINEFKLILESNNITSMDSFELYTKLKLYFNPEYNIERPTGHTLENIEIKFNDNTKYSDIKDIIKNANWYLSKINSGDIRTYDFNDNDIKRIEIQPLYSKTKIEPIPKYLYHISSTNNQESIINNGLNGSIGGKKGILHPKRIYLSTDIDTLERIAKELIHTVDAVIFKIDTNKANIKVLYVDLTVNQSYTNPKACYIQDMNILPNALFIVKELNLYK